MHECIGIVIVIVGVGVVGSRSVVGSTDGRVSTRPRPRGVRVEVAVRDATETETETETERERERDGVHRCARVHGGACARIDARDG